MNQIAQFATFPEIQTECKKISLQLETLDTIRNALKEIAPKKRSIRLHEALICANIHMLVKETDSVNNFYVCTFRRGVLEDLILNVYNNIINPNLINKLLTYLSQMQNTGQICPNGNRMLVMPSIHIPEKI